MLILQRLFPCRMKESDSGARLLALIYEKYVCELGWELEWSDGCLIPSTKCTKSHKASIVFLKSLCTWLNANVAKGDFLTAAVVFFI